MSNFLIRVDVAGIAIGIFAGFWIGLIFVIASRQVRRILGSPDDHHRERGP
jgi:hypothetical protein